MRESTSTKRKGVSLDDADAIDTGLFSSGPATIKESIFADYDYGGNSKPVAVWLLTFEREGEQPYEQPYSLGKGWKVSKDGTEIIPKMGQTGLPKNCNAMKHLVKPLKKALEEAGIDADVFANGDPSVLEGMDVVLRRVDQEKRDFREGGRGREAKSESKDRSILEVEEVTSAPWDKGGKKATKKKKADEDDDTEDEPRSKKKGRDEEDEDEDDAPKAKGKKKPVADEDEDEDAPVKGKKGAKGDDDEDTIKEEAIEALLEVLQDGDVDYDDLEGLVKKEVKGHKHAAEIVEWAIDTDNLELEKGWTYTKDKKTKTFVLALA